jgi:pimeloyl-ACP methyl ester carboxylesterase
VTADDALTQPTTGTDAGPAVGRHTATLVLLHGVTGDGHSHFGHLADHFADRRRVVLPDYAGSGTSTVPDGPLSLDLLVDEVASAVRHSSSTPIDLAGFSLGAVVAAATTAAHPELVRRLVLIAGWASSDEARHQLLFDTWAKLETADPELFARFGPLLAFEPAFLNGLGRQGLDEILSAGLPAATGRQLDLSLRVDLRDRLRRIEAPTLVIGCTRDHLVPVAHARALHDAIAGSHYAEIDSGHAVIFERPDELVKRVRDFLFRSEETELKARPRSI